IRPLPSAVKLPARVKALLNPPHSSVPAIKKAYCPFKLALEKVPVGGGGGGPTIVPPLLHAAVREASRIATSRSSRMIERLIADLLGWHAGQGTVRERRQRRAARPSPYEARGTARPFESHEQERRFPAVWWNSRPRLLRNHLLPKKSGWPQCKRPPQDERPESRSRSATGCARRWAASRLPRSSSGPCLPSPSLGLRRRRGCAS